MSRTREAVFHTWQTESFTPGSRSVLSFQIMKRACIAGSEDLDSGSVSSHLLPDKRPGLSESTVSTNLRVVAIVFPHKWICR